MKPIQIGIIVASVIVLAALVSQLGEEVDTVDEAVLVISDVDITPVDEQTFDKNLDCMGDAQCFEGIVSKIIDGDTIIVNDESIRFSLSSAPELQGYGGVDSKNFIEIICPVGSKVTVDEDDGQILGSYGRIIGLVYCNDVILNQELLDSGLGHLEERFCDSSEFAETTWAQKHGCHGN